MVLSLPRQSANNPITIAPKKDVYICFGVYYMKLKVVTVKNACSVLLMDEPLVFLSKPRIFSTLNPNYGYC